MRKSYTTPVPNVILDNYLKELGSVELKVLLIVIRQTLGWIDRRSIYGRKEIDWISGSQLQQKTGCSERAITSAIDGLIKKKLIEVLDDYGNQLRESKERQGKVRLFFRLHSSLNITVDNSLKTNPTSANFSDNFRKNYLELLQKVRITKETLTK